MTFGGSLGTLGQPGATLLTVTASSVDDARATSQAVSGGVYAQTKNDSTATVEPTVRAGVSDAALVHVTGNVDVSATEDPEADASTRGTSVGLLDFAGSQSKATAKPTVRALVGTSATILMRGGP